MDRCADTLESEDYTATTGQQMSPRDAQTNVAVSQWVVRVILEIKGSAESDTLGVGLF